MGAALEMAVQLAGRLALPAAAGLFGYTAVKSAGQSVGEEVGDRVGSLVPLLVGAAAVLVILNMAGRR